MTASRYLALVNDLVLSSEERTWAEFKENNAEPRTIGRQISALSNAARLADQHHAYMVWGVRDKDSTIVGTSFQPSRDKVGGDPLEFWLSNRLNPDVAFSFHEVAHPLGRLVLLEIPAATTMPIEFERMAYIRIGSATPRLSDHPSRLQDLWGKLRPYTWENDVAAQYLTGDEVLERLNHASFFELTDQPLPDNRAGIFERLSAENLIVADVGGRWNITNLGAVLFARNLNDFGMPLARKGVRFVAYDGSSRAASVKRRQDGKRGYATGFEGLTDYIGALLPENEHIGRAFRTPSEVFPSIAIRELIANALIHQDMTITGAGPLIELFNDRLEITNPGQPLVEPHRFIDYPPRSRNEALAALMRRMRICEEQGTGIDKVVASVEMYQLPAPDFRVENEAMRVVLFAPRRFAKMTVEERVRACYQHCVLKFVSGDIMRNSSLRERFGIPARNSSQVSQVIRAALDREWVRFADPQHPKTGYVPFWA